MKYVIETKDSDFTVEVPDDCTCEVNDYEGTRTVKFFAISPDDYKNGSLIAFYDNIEAVRCEEKVTRAPLAIA